MEAPIRYGYGDAGHEFDPDRTGRCRKRTNGYCDGTRTDPMHERREIRQEQSADDAAAEAAYWEWESDQ